MDRLRHHVPFGAGRRTGGRVWSFRRPRGRSHQRRGQRRSGVPPGRRRPDRPGHATGPVLVRPAASPGIGSREGANSRGGADGPSPPRSFALITTVGHLSLSTLPAALRDLKQHCRAQHGAHGFRAPTLALSADSRPPSSPSPRRRSARTGDRPSRFPWRLARFHCASPSDAPSSGSPCARSAGSPNVL